MKENHQSKYECLYFCADCSRLVLGTYRGMGCWQVPQAPSQIEDGYTTQAMISNPKPPYLNALPKGHFSPDLKPQGFRKALAHSAGLCRGGRGSLTKGTRVIKPGGYSGWA